MMTCRIARAFAVAMVLLTAASAAQATTVYVTTAAQNTVGGLSFGRGDVVAYDMDTDTATLAFSSYYFRNSNGRLNEVVDVIGVHAAGFGKVYLSMESGGYLGADGYRVHFRPGDAMTFPAGGKLDREKITFFIAGTFKDENWPYARCLANTAGANMTVDENGLRNDRHDSYVGEVIIFDRKLDAAEQREVMTYLVEKYKP